MTLLLAYMFRPGLLSWAALDLPAWAQWLGVAMGAASLLLIWWVQAALGSNFSTTLHLREEHTLVSHGPYRWVRHPMYTVLYLHLLAIFLLTQNWLIGGFFLSALTIIIATRLAKEEAVMIEKFGEEYQAYMLRSGRFLPRLR
jgi:protein-S-isoprenylcysteine O-methyltransferase Ste14